MTRDGPEFVAFVDISSKETEISGNAKKINNLDEYALHELQLNSNDFPMELIKIKTFNNRAEAEVAKSYLSSNGIDVQIQSDDVGGIYPAMTLMNGIHLLTSESQANEAQKLLEKIEQNNEN